MTAAVGFDAILAVLVLAVAGWTVIATATFAAVVGYVTLGLLLSLVWVRLAAIDVALTETAIGSGVTGVVLLAGAARLRPAEARAKAETPGPVLRLVAAILSALVTIGLALIVLLPTDPAPTLAPAAIAHLPEIGLGNPVNGVLIAYRAIDTLLEAVVLLLALLGLWSLAPDRAWGGIPGAKPRLRQDGPLAFLARLLLPVGIVVGIYVFWIGSSEPGGEFQGATILAAMWILVIMAGLREAPPTGLRWLRLLLVSGPAIFLAIGVAGFAWADGFLAFPVSHAKVLILVIEIPLTLSIAAMLGLLVAGPPESERQQ